MVWHYISLESNDFAIAPRLFGTPAEAADIAGAIAKAEAGRSGYSQLREYACKCQRPLQAVLSATQGSD